MEFDHFGPYPKLSCVGVGLIENTRKWPYLVQKAKNQTTTICLIFISQIAVKARMIAKFIDFSIRICKQIFS